MKIGFILAIFSRSGNMPVHRDWFIIRVSTCIILGAMHLSIIVEISSWPKLDLGLSFLTILETWSLSTISKLKDESL